MEQISNTKKKIALFKAAIVKQGFNPNRMEDFINEIENNFLTSFEDYFTYSTISDMVLGYQKFLDDSQEQQINLTQSSIFQHTKQLKQEFTNLNLQSDDFSQSKIQINENEGQTLKIHKKQQQNVQDGSEKYHIIGQIYQQMKETQVETPIKELQIAMLFTQLENKVLGYLHRNQHDLFLTFTEMKNEIDNLAKTLSKNYKKGWRTMMIEIDTNLNLSELQDGKLGNLHTTYRFASLSLTGSGTNDGFIKLRNLIKQNQQNEGGTIRFATQVHNDNKDSLQQFQNVYNKFKHIPEENFEKLFNLYFIDQALEYLEACAKEFCLSIFDQKQQQQQQKQQMQF